MLDSNTKKKIDDARDILVGKVPVPSSQVEQITIALIYKFMYDMDNESIELGGNPKYFTGDYAQYAWNKLFDPKLSGEGRVMLYQDALIKIPNNPQLPALFRDIFKNAFLPYRDPETLKLFLKCINEFTYEHSEKLGDAFEYLLAVLGSQGDAGQFRTPRHIIDFIVALIDPKKEDSILDPACGTAGFLISAYKHIIKTNSSNYDKVNDPHTFALRSTPLDELVIQNGKKYTGDLLTPDQRAFIHKNIKGYDIAFEMVRLSLVNMYLHGFNTPQIYEYDTLTSTDRWNEYASVILANPPFMTPKGGIRPHQRFTIQAKRSEVLFVDYMLEHLTTNGKAGIIVPEGIIFQSGNAYKQLRKLLVEENFLVGVISLPTGVFNPYSGVKTSILWIDKALAKKTDKIIFIKVNNDGFDLGANRRPIEANDLPATIASAEAFKQAVFSGNEFQVPDNGVILVDKAKLADSKDYNLNGGLYNAKKPSCSKWDMEKLCNLVDIVMGGTPKSGTPEYWGDDVNWVTLVDLPPTDFITTISNTARKITKLGLTNSSAKLLPVNTVLVSSRATIGRVAINTVPLATNQGFKNLIVKDPDIIDYKYLAYVIRSMRDKLESLGTGGTYKEVSKSTFDGLLIPLPPLSVQEEIVAELDSYQKIIDGAKQVVDNWKPHIDIDPNWDMVKLKELCTFEYGKGLPEKDRISGPYPVLGSNGVSGYHNSSFVKGPVIVVGRKGSAGEVVWEDRDCCPIDTTFYIKHDKRKIVYRYLYYVLKMANLQNLRGGTGIPGLNRNDAYELLIPLPDIETQNKIIQGLIDEEHYVAKSRKMIKHYDELIVQRIRRIWINETSIQQ